MNKFTFLLTILFFVQCKSNRDVLEIKTTKEPIILKYNKERKKIYGIKIPFQLIVYNNSNFSPKEFITIDYNYYPNNKGVGEEIYIKKNKLIRIKNNQKKIVPPSKANKYIIYSRYRIDQLDEVDLFNKKLKVYLDEVQQKNKDTLHIGTVSEFRKKHKELFDRLIKNDGISIRFLQNGKPGKRVTIPVKW